MQFKLKIQNFVKYFIIISLFILPLILSGCGNNSTKANSNTVKIGIVGSTNEQIFKPLAQQVKKEGINLQIVDFSDMNQPNQALLHNEIDVNAFQTQQGLDNFNKANKTNLIPVGKIGIGPITLYSKQINNLNQLKNGDSIAIPNDTSSEGRALNLLASAGLINIKQGVNYPTIKDITKNKKNLSFKELDPAETPRSLKDVKAAVINNVFALDAKLPDKDAIYHEKLDKKIIPYINIFASNKSDKNNENIRKIVKAYHSEENLKRFNKVYHGTAIPAWNLKLK